MKKKKKKNTLRVILIGTSVVMFWRGAWGLMDLIIFPENELLSYLVSLITGIIILLTTHKLIDELT